MNKKTLTITTIVLALTIAFSSMAMAYGGPRGEGGGHMPQLFDKLTPEKQQEVRDIFDKHKEKFLSIKNDMFAKQLELDALTKSGVATKSDIKSLVADIADLREDMFQEHEAVQDEIEAATGLQLPPFGMGGGFGRGMDDDRGPRPGKSGFGSCGRF